MMTDRQLIDKFLELQEQAGHMTDEQMQAALDNEQMHELTEQMALAKRAFKNEAIDVPSVDEAWAKFEAAHPSPFSFRKSVAVFAGFIVASGIVFAAFHAVRNNGTLDAPVAQDAPYIAADTLKTDTTAVEQQRVFDNVTLEKMLPEIAAVHHARVDFQNKAARLLRFHFVWKREESLERTVEKLNTFEAVDITIENKTLIVR